MIGSEVAESKEIRKVDNRANKNTIYMNKINTKREMERERGRFGGGGGGAVSGVLCKC